MNNVWLKIRVWTKSILITAILIYLSVFILKNSGVDRRVSFWYWYNGVYEGQLLVLMGLTFLSGAIAFFLIRTFFKTLKQLRELRVKREQKEAAEMVIKAAKLQQAHPSSIMEVASKPTINDHV